MRRNLAHLLSLAHERADRWLVAELAAAGLKGLAPSHGDVLACLYRQGEATMHELAAFARRTKPTTTILVDKLESLGYVAREASTADARCQIVSLTPQGEALRPKFADISRRLVARAYAGFSPAEADALDAALERLLSNFTPNPTTNTMEKQSWKK